MTTKFGRWPAGSSAFLLFEALADPGAGAALALPTPAAKTSAPSSASTLAAKASRAAARASVWGLESACLSIGSV